jgi:cysteine desulfurase/selenocysteine lyase
MPWAATRELFPVTRSLVYLNHAGVAPISTRVAEALAHYSRLASEEGAYRYNRSFAPAINRTRVAASRLLGASPEEIAFIKNTTEGLGIVANGLDWQPGDKVITGDLEYPSNVYPWWHLKSKGVETLMLKGSQGRYCLDDLKQYLSDPQVRLLSLSSVEFGSGARNDLDVIGKLCREHDVLFCVDAIQSLGCLSLDVSQTPIDFLAADGHKWMLGCEGCGIFYCRRERIPLLRPATVGWRNVVNSFDFDNYNLELPDDAIRFEEGTLNLPGIFALGAALELLLELDVEAIEKRVLSLTDQLEEGVCALGGEILSPRSAGEKSGILSFQLPGEDPETTVERLRARNIFSIVRRGGVRLSPHFYNNESEIDLLLDALKG